MFPFSHVDIHSNPMWTSTQSHVTCGPQSTSRNKCNMHQLCGDMCNNNSTISLKTPIYFNKNIPATRPTRSYASFLLCPPPRHPWYPGCPGMGPSPDSWAWKREGRRERRRERGSEGTNLGINYLHTYNHMTDYGLLQGSEQKPNPNLNR